MISPLEIADHAKRLLTPVLEGTEFDDELFLCGGAYKSMLNPSLPVSDLDLWVRDRKKREMFTQAFVQAGAELISDFQPFCLKFTQRSVAVELNYQNLNDLGISRVMDHCDLGVCALGAVWQQGEIIDVVVSDSFLKSVRDQTVYLHDTFLQHLTEARPPSLLRTLHRLERAATELGYRLAQSETAALWDIYGALSETDKQANLDVYLETMVDYKGCCNETVLRQARSMLQAAPPGMQAH